MPITKATASSVAPAAKGDLVVGSATNDAAVLGVGSNDQVLTADSSTATGLKWATASSGGMTLISTTTLTGASVTISSIPQTFVHLQLILVNPLQATDATSYRLRVNNDTGTQYKNYGGEYLNAAPDATFWTLAQLQDNTVSECTTQTTIMNYTATTRKTAKTLGVGANSTTDANFNMFDANHAYNQTTAISSLVLFPGSGNWTSGTALLYGVK